MAAEEDREAELTKAIAFFERAEEVASTNNFDYAIDLYLEGLRKYPDAVEDGHIPLRRMALVRQEKGGKKASVVQKMKFHGGKTPLEEMLNAAYLLARDPDHTPYAEALLKACVAGGYSRTAEWIADLVFQANAAGGHSSRATYLLLKDSYAELRMFAEAIKCCQLAIDIKPGDLSLQDELRDLSAQMTVQKGGYGRGGDFRDSIRDREAQERLHSQGKIIKSADFHPIYYSDNRQENYRCNFLSYCHINT